MLNANKITTKHTRKIITVSELNSLARAILEDSLAIVSVSGEISNLAQPSSGHIYFSLKDQTAQIRCALFRGYNHALKFKPKNGDHVIVTAQVSIYEARGDYQLIAQSMELAGDGILHEKFLQLKNKLAAEGLFDAKYKKPIPKLPNCIGVVTSPTGAAIRDILSVLKRRFPSIPVIIYPTSVQGAEAASQIVAALAVANTRAECDVLIVARGGGSLEDLWPFNEEIVARAIFASTIPIVSGVGHEVDFTIADFVADQRAPTPSAAAELVAPDVSQYAREIEHLWSRLNSLMHYKLRHLIHLLLNLRHRLRHPLARLQQQAQRIDDLEQRLKIGGSHLLQHKRAKLNHCVAQLAQNSPENYIAAKLQQNTLFAAHLDFGITKLLQKYQNRLQRIGEALAAINPLAVLNRGYAIVTKDAKVVSDAGVVNVDDQVQIKLAQGQLRCQVLIKDITR